jgi:hypothetical protein
MKVTPLEQMVKVWRKAVAPAQVTRLPCGCYVGPCPFFGGIPCWLIYIQTPVVVQTGLNVITYPWPGFWRAGKKNLTLFESFGLVLLGVCR